MKQITNKMMMTVAIIIIAITGCKKENEVTPENTLPAVSFKPKSIVTTKDGSTEVVRTQTYEYDSRNTLVQFVCAENTTRDSLLFTPDGIGFIRKVRGVTETTEILRFNPDKSLKELSSIDNGITTTLSSDFSAVGNGINALTSLNGIPDIRIGFSYEDGDLKRVSSGEEGISFTYSDNLSFQKGINEMPVESTSLRYHKIAEQEDLINYRFSSRLIRSATVTEGAVIKKVYDYSYVQDAHGRVTIIFETISFPFSGSATLRFQHTITY